MSCRHGCLYSLLNSVTPGNLKLFIFVPMANFWINNLLLVLNSGYYMAAQRYEISRQVLKNISRVRAANE